MVTIDFKNDVAKWFRPMANFSIRVFTMAIVISLAFASCSKDDDDDNGDDGKDVEMTAENWQKVIKENYDFDLTVPTGWSYKEGKKENINPAYRIDFNTSASDFKAAVQVIHQYLFDLTAKITPTDGNFEMESYSPLVKGDKITELKENSLTGDLAPALWHFNTPKGAVQISFSYSEPNKFVRITLVFLGKIQ